MKTKFLIIAIIAIAVLVGCNRRGTNEATGNVGQATGETNKMFVNATAGLRVRTAPVDGDVIGLLNNLQEVTVLEVADNEVVIDGTRGKWTLVESGNLKGWVFGGFLKTASEQALAERFIGFWVTNTEYGTLLNEFEASGFKSIALMNTCAFQRGRWYIRGNELIREMYVWWDDAGWDPPEIIQYEFIDNDTLRISGNTFHRTNRDTFFEFFEVRGLCE